MLAFLALACTPDEKPADTGCALVVWWPDHDGDGFGVAEGGYAACADPGDGRVLDTTDCDDVRADVFPGADEVCDGADQDCDGEVDEDPVDGIDWYFDLDQDGYGNAAVLVTACEAPDGYVADATDCNDFDPFTRPGGREHCDGIDEDCDGTVDDDASDTEEIHPDADGDGYGDAVTREVGCAGTEGYTTDASDCDDADPERHPGADETWYDGVDQDCAGDDDFDQDADGWGLDEDCDDTDAGRRPGAREVCDAVDDDCDGSAPTEETDADGDGRTDCVACDVVVPDDVATVQGALDAAADGDVLCVRQGTYVENLDFGGVEATLLGLGGAAGTILDGGCGELEDGDAWDPLGPVVRFESGEGAGAVLTGFTITRGCSYDKGAGIRVVGASPTVDDVIVTDNYVVDWDGGGIYAEDGQPTFTHVRVTDNMAALDYTGWFYGWGAGVSLYAADAIFENVVIADNEAEDAGAGVYVRYASPVFTNVVISGNDPGGFDTEYAAVVLVNVVVSGNTGTGLSAYQGDAVVSYSAISDGVSGMDDPVGSDGNVATVAVFNDDEYHLTASSSLADAGDPSILDPDGSTSDMGAWGGPGADTWDLDGDGYPSFWLPGVYRVSTSDGLDCDDDDPTVFPGAGC